MTQVSSLPSSTADVNDMYHNKRLPKGIHIVGADNDSVSKVGGMSPNDGLPWGYIFIQHMSAGAFEKHLETRKVAGDYKPRCFVHRTLQYKKKPNGKGIMKEEKPTVSGLVFCRERQNN